MFTHIGKYMAVFQVYGTNIPSISTGNVTKASIKGKSISGTDCYLAPYRTSSGTSFLNTAITESSYGVAMGSDDTPATENDYNLGAQITGLTATVNATNAFDAASGKYISQLEYTVSNNTGSDVTVKEIGYFVTSKIADTLGGALTGTNKCFMLDRTVLETPVSIPNGESSIVRYCFVYPGDTE